MRPAQQEHDRRLGLGIHQIGRAIAANARVEHRALDRRFVATHERVDEHVGREHPFEIVRVAHRVGQSHAGVFGRRIHFDGGVGGHEGGLPANRVGSLVAASLGLRQVAVVEETQHAVDVHIAIEHDVGVVETIMAGMGVEIAFVGEAGDGRRVAARFEGVAGVGQEGLAERVVEHAFGVGQGALHLVEDHAVVRKPARPLCLVELVVPAFLLENAPVAVDGRMEHGVEVHVHQVEQVLLVGARHRVHGLVGEGERIEEGLHRGLQQVHEGLFDGEFVGPAKHRMLQDVEDARVVGGRGLEGDREGLVGVVVFQIEQPRPARLMAEHEGFAVDFGEGLAREHVESVPVLIGF